ncbi:MAG: copper amine oxidase N-terminal domain-containing protein, partial [bacterium]
MIRKFVILLAIAGLLLTLVTPIAVAGSGNRTIEVNYRDITIWVDGKQISADTEPFLFLDRTFVPLRAIAEALGQTVSWDDPNNRVIIGQP